MSEKLQDQRLIPPAKAVDHAAYARNRRTAEEVLAKALVAAHHRVFPPDQDIQYVVTQRRGRVRVQFQPPAVHESGWCDA